MFLRNAWYVVALERELGQRPLQRWILGEPIALFRTASGRAAAIADRCPHRGAPISSGEVVGETLVCGYHGFAFELDGRCTSMPGTAKIPPSACVRAYPVIERWGWLFAWMGEPAKADETLLPPFHWMRAPGWVGDNEMMSVKSAYTLVRDNLLDLTHARYVHRKTLGTSAVTDHPVRTDTDERRVRVVREMPDIEPSPFFRQMGGFTGRVDHRQQIDFVPPCYVIINTRVQSTADSGENRAAEFQVLNALVPEHAGATHYFWGLVRNFAIDDPQVTETQQTLNRATFQEDVSILEQQQRLLECAPTNWRPLPTHHDAGCVQAERLLDRLLAAEREAAR